MQVQTWQKSKHTSTFHTGRHLRAGVLYKFSEWTTGKTSAYTILATDLRRHQHLWSHNRSTIVALYKYRKFIWFCRLMVYIARLQAISTRKREIVTFLFSYVTNCWALQKSSSKTMHFADFHSLQRSLQSWCVLLCNAIGQLLLFLGWNLCHVF